MKKSAIKWMGIMALLAGVLAIAAGCSQGVVPPGGTTPTRPAATQPAAGATSPAPTATKAAAPTVAVAGGPKSNSSTVYRQKPLSTTVSGSTVLLPVSAVTTALNGNFSVNVAGNYMSFMAYQLDGKTFVRADICPPCGSRSFTLSSGKLTCDACGTVFNATSGAGVSGACIAYPKALVPYTVDGDNMVLNVSDLTTAYQKTISRKGLS